MSEQARIKDLTPYHRNPRKGDVGAIKEALQELGQYRPITVNRGTHTGRPNEILTGNHTYQAAKALKWETIAVAYVDETDDNAAKIVVADNRTSDLGEYDDGELTALLGELPDLTGTGYDDDDIADLLVSTEAPAPAADDELDDDESKWAAASRKAIILGYTLERFVWMQEQLAKLGKGYGTTSNAETLKRLLEDAA